MKKLIIIIILVVLLAAAYFYLPESNNALNEQIHDDLADKIEELQTITNNQGGVIQEIVKYIKEKEAGQEGK